ncbi:MAG: ATP-binding protein [Anaerolineales bacterium]
MTLDSVFGTRPSELPLGTVIDGSLSEGLRVRLNPQFSLEKLAVGRYVVIRGRETGLRFFGMLTDVALESANPDLGHRPPPAADAFQAEVYRGELAYGSIHVSPLLVLDDSEKTPRPVKTIPGHFSSVYEASAQDVARIFGEGDETHFFVGTPLDMDQVPIHLDLARFVERSSGVFGKSGTGKSFLTRTILAGIMRSRIAAALVFDMHNDYGWAVQGEAGREFKGLRQLFPDGRVSVYTLDPATSRARESKVDGELQIAYSQIEPEDIELLSGLMGLSEVQTAGMFILQRRLGRNWVQQLMADETPTEITAMVESGRLVQGTVEALQRRFESFLTRMGFLVPEQSGDPVEEIFQRLSRGQSVVLEFGTYGNNLAAYMLAANFLTRRIHRRYVERQNLAAGKKADGAKPLVIVIEEAHKFLNSEVAEHTVFGTIARELRKYNVTLLIVDQRPSGIDEEVMSQIGTRVTCLLDNEADIRAVFSGVSGAAALREVLARLDTRQQALVLGHAVPMPVVLRARDYGPEFYASLGVVEGEELKKRARRGSETLFGS